MVPRLRKHPWLPRSSDYTQAIAQNSRPPSGLGAPAARPILTHPTTEALIVRVTSAAASAAIPFRGSWRSMATGCLPIVIVRLINTFNNLVCCVGRQTVNLPPQS
jgi:hypothetical protein